MKTKGLLMTLVALMMCCVSNEAYASDIAVENADGVMIYYNYINDGQELEVTSAPNKYSGSVVIPEEVTFMNRALKVTRIGNVAFDFCGGLTSVTIPNSVTSIGNGAFRGCIYLTSVNIPESVTSIAASAFSNCTGLTSITIPNSVTTIGNSAFSGCTSLTSITIPNSVTTIGNSAFKTSRALKSAIIGSGVTTIGEDAFGVNPIKTIWLTSTVPEGSSYATGTINYVTSENLNSIKNTRVYPFLKEYFEVDGIKYVPVSTSERTCDAIDCIYDNSMESVNIGETVNYKNLSMKVKKVLPYTFYGNTFTRNVKLNSNGDICENAFQGCSNIQSVELGEGITSIGDYAFQDCGLLSEMLIPDKVTNIGNYAFSNCTVLTNISFGSQLSSIGKQAFEKCTALTQITCKASTPPVCGDLALNDIDKWVCKLYVPSESKKKYQAANQWQAFLFIEAMDGGGGETPEEQVCEKPTIHYQNGQLAFECATEGVEYQYSIIDSDIKSGISAVLDLSVTYQISVYATKNGYTNSETATATLCWIDVEPQKEGITEEDEDAVAQVKAVPVLIQAEGNMMTINGAAPGTPINVYDLNGRQLSSATAAESETRFNVGTYEKMVLVKVGEKTIKIAL